ncbi:MAG: hybrid sensor histidine kinase/response regulator, partial [Campylobacterota bacterium]
MQTTSNIYQKLIKSWLLISQPQYRYIPALLLLFIFITVGTIFSKYVIEVEQKNISIINTSGKQRMLSQKLMIDARKFIENSTNHNKKTYMATINTMKKDHKDLAEYAFDKSYAKDFYFTDPNVNKLVLDYINNHKSILQAPSIDRVKHLRKKSQQLLQTLDQATALHEKKYNKTIENLQLSIWIYYLTFSIVLLLEGIYIFKPAAKEIVNTTDKLEKQKQKAKAASRSKSEFLANMSHEIRTPLNAILGFVDLLKERIEEPQSKKYLQTIDSSSHHLLGVINDILDFSKLESGKLHVEKVDFDVKKEFATIYQLFNAQVSQKNIDLVMELDTNVPPVLVGDPLRIKQVITNLLSNAIKFTPEHKKIYLTISYSDERLKVSVKDEGIGIAKEKLALIFEAFSQADSSTTREYGGTGLGLSISSELVALMGGSLQAVSTQAQGSEFYFSIPAPKGKLDVLRSSQPAYESFKGKKVLLVEDNKANQVFMKVVLKKLDVAYDIANDGLEAVEMFGQNDYDLILMDENMPNLSGIEATKEILSLEKEKEKS